MKRTIFHIILACAVVLTGCKGNPSSKECIYTSIAPLKYIVEGIVGDDYDVEVLVPAGASPETFSPTPRQIIALNEAKIIFGTGLLEFESALLGKVEEQSKIVDLSTRIEVIRGTCSHSHHGHHCAHGIDPHVWCSPRQLMTMAESAFEAISKVLPDSIAKYEPRYMAICEELASLDEEVTEACRNAPRDYFVIYHPALTYYARDYGMEQVAIEHEGKEASARRLAEIIDRARTDGIKRVLYQSEFPRSSVETICEDMGAEAVEINPLTENIVEELRRITYLITE